MQARRGSGVYIVGAGKVGAGLALALRRQGERALGLSTRSPTRARAVQRLLGQRVDTGLGPALAEADLVIVAVSDAAVPAVGRALAAAGLRRGAVVAHTAGVLPAQALGVLPGVHVGGLHPLAPCTSAAQAARVLVGAPYTIEGDATARRALRRLVSRLDGEALELRHGDKARYHAALVLASNLVVALLHLAHEEARAAGFAHPAAIDALAARALDLAIEVGPKEALTGPIVRGDATTVAAHLGHLSAAAAPAYRALSEPALALAEARGLAPAAARHLRRVLRGAT